MRSFQEDELRARYGAWRYWRWLARLRGLWLWARVRWAGWTGWGGVIRLGPGLYIWPRWRSVGGDFEIHGSPTVTNEREP